MKKILMNQTLALVVMVSTLTLVTGVAAGNPEVHRSAVYGVNVSQIVYATGSYCNGTNFSQTSCKTVNLTADLYTPVLNTSTNVPLPTGPRPMLLAIHGGSYSHGDSSEYKTYAEYFAARGWMVMSINYRLCNGGYDLTSGVGTEGDLVCHEYGQFPSHGPYGNSTCGSDSIATFGLNTDDGCALSSPPKVPDCFFGTLMSWMYPSVRDAKASVRFIRANAKMLNIDPDFITAIGGSAGACSVVGLATTFEDDYKNELTLAEDPTLASTNMQESSAIATGLVQWGGDYVPLYTQLRDPQNRTRYSKQSAPLSTYHGSADGVINPAMEDQMMAAYKHNGVRYDQHILQGAGHGADSAPVVLPNGTNQTQSDNMFDFLIQVQPLQVVSP